MPNPTIIRRLLAAGLAGLLMSACAAATPPPQRQAGSDLALDEPRTHGPRGDGVQKPPSARLWPDASARFHSEPEWLGADSAYSIAVDPQHVLWLFADTFLDPARDGTRTNGPNVFIRNSAAIQSGDTPEQAHDLSRSRIDFYWGPANKAGSPSSFFHDADGSEHWIWPLHGACLPSGQLLIFRMHVVKDSSPFGFRVDGWDAVAIDDPLLPPDQWQPRQIRGPQRPSSKLVGSSVLLHGAHLYAYAVDETSVDHAIYLVRWPLAQLVGLASGALDDPAWWTGHDFVRESALSASTPAVAVFGAGQVELSVHYEADHQRFVEVQMTGLFASDPHTQLSLRTAQEPWGPWSAPVGFFRPVEAELENAADLIAYAGKAHPEQRGPGGHGVLTYVVNDLKHFPPADRVYYPQLVQMYYAPSPAPAVPGE
jgi:hypothetical protein